MNTPTKRVITMFLLVFLLSLRMEAQVRPDELKFSAIKGMQSKPDTISIVTQKKQAVRNVTITGPQANYFKLTKLPGSDDYKATIVFAPPSDFEGVANAVFQAASPPLHITLTGLSTKGLEGENEAPLSTIFSALGYATDPGWKTLANNTRPEPVGDELPPSLFRKTGNRPVTIIPVARYSPDFALNYGVYFNSPTGPRRQQAGILAKAAKYPEHQTLFPAMASGSRSVETGDRVFGFYAVGPDHSIYTEDCWNTLFHPGHASHAVRIYPVKNTDGQPEANAFLVCMEEAANGDYNDYVFLVRNVEAVPLDRDFESLLNGRDFEGWYTWVESKGKNNDPEKIFTMEDGVLHDTGKEAGYLMTTSSYGNFHLTLEFKWGEKRWAPRENAKRDSGICYNIPENEPDHIWPQSVECQIQETDVGDFWLLGYSTIQVNGKQNLPLPYSQVVKAKDGEKPRGEWNKVEVISFNGKCAHIVNGVLVNFGENSSLVGGRILLQSEFAELFYRNVKLRRL